jgi:peptidoglycan hydrolase-like protein with peptidoglycan-binding domain
MKGLIKNPLTLAFAISLALGFAGPIATLAATTPSLGTTGPFGILSGTFTNSNTSPQTIVNAGVCYTTPPTTVPLTITGATITPCSSAMGTDQAAALTNLNGQACTSLGAGAVALDSVIVGINPPGTFPPGCYSSGGAMSITLGTTVTLNGVGTYIFKPTGALTTGANSDVVLTGGAGASDVFWVPTAAASLGANAALSATPTFIGNIIDPAGITLGHFANLLGRASAIGGTVTTDANTITIPTTLHVIKLVINANGGTAVASSFTVHVKNGASEVVGSPASGAAAPGTSYTLAAGTYTVSENANASYTQSFTGACDSNGNVTLAAGDDKTCTIVNSDIPAPAPLVPISSGGSSTGVGGRIVPLIGLLKVPSPLALPGGSGSVTYNYTVWNVGGQQALDDITVTDDKCSPLTYVSGDLNGNGKLDPHEIWTYACTTTLSQTTTNTSIATGYSDDVHHQPTVATAIATVVVGSTLTPPLINIIKVPSRLTPFLFGGGPVTYSYIITNPGTVAMHNVSVSDNKCSPILGPSAGDTNGNGLLDPGESWAYTCQTNILFSTTNIATAEGTANGFTALDYAFATVLVSAPGLPNTGFPPGPIQTITDDLQQGSSNGEVTILQQFLISQNGGMADQALANAGVTGYFGSLTRAALAEFQSNAGISPASGNFGPITRAYLSAN